MSDSFDTPPPPSDFQPGEVQSAGAPVEFVPRLIAYLIDGFIGFAAAIPGLVLLFIGSAIGGVFGTLVLLLGLLLIGVSALATLYIFIWGIAVNGQTPGKRIQGIRVVQDSGEPLGLGGAVIRFFALSISNSILCGLPIGSAWMLWDGEKKTLYDKVLNYQATNVAKGGLMPLFPNGKPF